MSVETPGASPFDALVERILAGQAPQQARAAAARGALPLPKPQLVRLFLALRKDPIEEIRLDAERSLQGLHGDALREILADPACPPGVLAHFAPQAARDEKLAEAVAFEGAFFLLRFPGTEDLVDLLERHGKLPLPPYIQRHSEAADEARYQTVYARARGSVAAPTAGLHFDEALLDALRAKRIDFAWLTLHVGAGTFQPVRVEDLARHRMHRERYVMPADTVTALAAARTRGGRVVAVGTTSLRALEAAAQKGEILAGPGETELFILPGFRFRTADALITNFHLPKSTLLMLVSAFGGLEIALWDLRGKAWNQPLYMLLGGAVRKAIPFTEYFGFRRTHDGARREVTAEAVVDYCLKMRQEHGSTLFEGKLILGNPALEIDDILELYISLLDHTILQLRSLQGVDTFIAFAPEGAREYFSGFGVSLIALPEGDIGESMCHA